MSNSTLTVPNPPSNFVGDGGSGGAAGLVPAPTAGYGAAQRFLDADGTWAIGPMDIPGGRLTTESGAPISVCTPTSRTAQGSVYYALYNHDRIRIYDGTQWKFYQFTELTCTLSDTTKSPAAVVTDKNYDMYVWDDAGTLRLSRSIAWTGDTTRGTGAGTAERERVNGVWVNKIAITNGPSAQRGRYVGTIRGTGTSTTEDSTWKRLVWNAYNQVDLALFKSSADSDNGNDVTTTSSANFTNFTDLFVMVVTGNDGISIDIGGSMLAANDSTTAGWAAGIAVSAITACPVAGFAKPNGTNLQSYETVSLRWQDTKVAGYQIYYLVAGTGGGTLTIVYDLGGSNGESWAGWDDATTYLSGRFLG